jgi:hypothetical protein
MIQCTAPGTLDLELGKLSDSSDKTLATTTSKIFQHLQILLLIDVSRKKYTSEKTVHQGHRLCRQSSLLRSVGHTPTPFKH